MSSTESINSLLLRMRDFWLIAHSLASVSSQEPPAIIHLDVVPQHPLPEHPPPQHSQPGQALGVEPLEGAGSNSPEFSWPPHSGASSCFPAHPFSFFPEWGSFRCSEQVQNVPHAFGTPVLCVTLHLRGSSDLGEITKGRDSLTMIFTPGAFSKGEKILTLVVLSVSLALEKWLFVCFMPSDQCKSSEQGLQPGPKTPSNSHCVLVEVTREPSQLYQGNISAV